MTRDDILRMAREVGGSQIMRAGKQEVMEFTVEPLERFAALIAAAEREECAKVCEEHATTTPTFKQYEDNYEAGWLDSSNECSWMIRARGQE